jgi:hypothetical protein
MTASVITSAAHEHSTVAVDTDAGMRRVRWALRIGSAGCFIGHGAFGIITKSAWLPYFAVLGIQPETAYRIMPIVGTIDILAGISVLVSPMPIVLLYMSVWGLWTAMLRPLSGESVFEMVERAGNFMVPFALLMLTVMRSRPATIARILQVATSMLLFGHGALEAITGKAVFVNHYASIGLPASIAPYLGVMEMIVALVVLVYPSVALLVAIAVWKIATESLYPVSGTPIWEFIERAGSYAAPIALALLSSTTKLTSITTRRSST